MWQPGVMGLPVSCLLEFAPCVVPSLLYEGRAEWLREYSRSAGVTSQMQSLKDTAASALVALALGSLPLEEGGCCLTNSLVERPDQGPGE